MRWSLLLPLSLLLAAGQMAVTNALGGCAPSLFFLLALHLGLTSTRSESALAWWWAGLARDLSVGSHLGASALLFLLFGEGTLFLRQRIRRSHIATHLLFLLGGVPALRLGEAFLANPARAAAAWPEILGEATASAALTAAAGAVLFPILTWLPLLLPGHRDLPVLEMRRG
ncbi:MAG: hypothetical protein V1918_08515 [Planctomycetota bacterium]